MSKKLKWYELEMEENDKQYDKLINTKFTLYNNYRGLNIHRKQSKATNWRTYIIDRMLSTIAKLKEINKQIDSCINRNNTLGMYSDADEDMKLDAEISYKETMQELGIEVINNVN